MASKKHEVVISGLSGKFPSCANIEEFREKLCSKKSLLTSDAKRWNPVEHPKPFMTGKIKNADKFDISFFGISSIIERNCDPVFGPLLENAIEAIFDSGVNPFSLKGRDVTVVAVSSLTDAEMLRHIDDVFIDGAGVIGLSRAMLANRLSFFLDLTGASYNLDASWVSTVQSLEVAANLIAKGRCEAAIVFATNLTFHNSIEDEYRGLGLLSSSEKCAPFDAEADGFVRSEGSVAFFLQRREDARRHYCTLLGAEARCLGSRDCSYTRIDNTLKTFLSDFYTNCGVDPGKVSYVEAFGLSEEDYDTKELNALAGVFDRNINNPMLVGSLTGNMGISECPSGFVSLAKAIIAMETGVIPPNVNYNKPNPRVPALVNGRLKPVTELTSLNGDLVAVNGLNFSGNASHVVVKRHDKSKKPLSPGELPPDGLPRLVLLQARNEDGARTIADKLSSISTVDVEFVSMVNDVFNVPTPAYLWRGYAVLPVQNKGVQNVQLFEPTKRPLWFVFSGMGSQWAGMGRDLLSIPAFSSAMDKCDAVLRPRGVDLKHIITHNDMKVFDDAVNSFVGITAIQLGLVDVLKTVGISADGLVGHSGGEVACGYADGCMTIEETILAAYYRGKAVTESDFNDIKGLMAAVGMGYSTIKDHLPENIDVACHNASDSSTLSGPTDDILKYVEELKGQGVFAKIVDSAGIAYHSRTIKAVYPRLLKYLKEGLPDPKRRSTRWISSSVLQNQWDSEDAQFCSAEYMTNNLTNPVYFEEACLSIPRNSIVIEIAPRGLLQAILRRSIGPETLNVSLTNRTSESNVLNVLNALGKLHLNNVDMNINALYPTIDYPVSRGTPSLASLVTWDHDVSRYQDFHRLIKKMLQSGTNEAIENIGKDHSEYEMWQDHLIDNQVALPTFQIMLYPLKMIFKALKLDVNQHIFILEDLKIKDNVLVSDTNTPLFVALSLASLKFEVMLGNNVSTSWRPVMSGRVNQSNSFGFTEINSLPLDTSFKETVNEAEVYELFARFGCMLGPKFRNIKSILIGKSGCLAKVQWTTCIVTFIDSLFKLVEYIHTEAQQRSLRTIAFTKLVVNSEALNKIPLGSLLEVIYDYRTNVLSCECVRLHGLILGPYTRKDPALKWKELGIERQSPREKILTNQNGSRGVLNNLMVNTCDIIPKMTDFANLFTSRDPLLEIACVGLNSTTFTLLEGSSTKECDIKYVDYAGHYKSQKVMGIGEVDPQTNTLKLDTTLRWPVPAEWTTEDAASVPLTYALAYTCMHLIAEVKPKENVLIHAGISPIGQAIIRIAIDLGANIISTVENESDVTTLQNMFPSIKRSHIIVLNKAILDVSLKTVTKGKGVDVAVNCFRGKTMQATARNLSYYSKILHLSEIRVEDREILGLFMFIKSSSFHAVTLDNVLHCNQECKSILHKLISDGTKNGTVKPLRRATFDLKHENEALSHLNTLANESKTLLVSNQKKPVSLPYRYDEVVVVAGTKTDLSLSLCKWLMKRGARKLVLLTEKKHFNNNSLRRLRKLMAHFKATVIFSAVNPAKDYEIAEEILKDTSCLGTVAAIFCVNMNENDSPMKNLDSASRKVLPQLRHFVSLLGEGTAVCQSRASASLPMVSVICETTLHNPSIILSYLSTILEENTSRASFLVVGDNISTTRKSEDLGPETFLPRSVDSLSKLGLQVQDKTSFFEVITRSPGYQHVKYSLLPVFVIPSLGCESLEPLLRQLLHPAFCSSIPTCYETVGVFAEALFKNTTKIQKKGSYSIVGDCWNGFVTLALGCLLEAQGHQVEIFLLEGTPSSAKNRVSALCSRFNGDLGASLLAAIPGLKTAGESRKDSWTNQVDKALLNVPAPIKESSRKALNSICSQLNSVQQCDPSINLFKGRVHLITCRDASRDVNNLLSICQQSPTILVTGDENYQQLIANPKVAAHINDNILFDWKL